MPKSECYVAPDHKDVNKGEEGPWQTPTVKVNVYCKEQTVVPDRGTSLHQRWIYCAWFSQVIYMDYTTFSLFVACLDNQKIFL